MRLKQLRVFGFKTFAEPLKLDFEPGITAIVGPNGSGKSNLVDAIRWALGEQSTKQLRSNRTDDVIFAGNTKRKPLGMAEVSLVFDNEDRHLPVDFNEVEISRRAYRAGEIEYYLNRSARALARRHGRAHGQRPRSGLVLDRLARADRRDSLIEADRTARALRRDGRHRALSGAQERSVAPARAHRSERDSHQRSDCRARAAHSGARHASAPRQALPAALDARPRSRAALVHACQQEPPRRTRSRSQRSRKTRRASSRCGRACRSARRRSHARFARRCTVTSWRSKNSASARKMRARSLPICKRRWPRRMRAAKRSKPRAAPQSPTKRARKRNAEQLGART